MGPALQDSDGLHCILAAAQAARGVEVRTLVHMPAMRLGSHHRAFQAHTMALRWLVACDNSCDRQAYPVSESWSSSHNCDRQPDA